MSTPIETNTTSLEELLQIAQGLPTQSTTVMQSKTVTPSNANQTVSPDSGYDGLSSVTVEGDSDLVSGNIKSGVSIFGVTGSLENGAEVKVATGTVTGVSGSDKTVDCGFKPDAVFFTGTNPNNSNAPIHAGIAFTEAKVTSMNAIFAPPSTSYILSQFTVNQTSTGFQIYGVRMNMSFQVSNESNRSVNYIAIKYTE